MDKRSAAIACFLLSFALLAMPVLLCAGWFVVEMVGRFPGGNPFTGSSSGVWWRLFLYPCIIGGGLAMLAGFLCHLPVAWEAEKERRERRRK